MRSVLYESEELFGGKKMSEKPDWDSVERQPGCADVANVMRMARGIGHESVLRMGVA